MSGKPTTRSNSAQYKTQRALRPRTPTVSAQSQPQSGTKHGIAQANKVNDKSHKTLTVHRQQIGEPETRRSSRATKGQHTKAFDQLENGPEPSKRRQSKKSKKAAEKEADPEDDDNDEEVIRCICGATTQDDDDANEPWIACDKCGAWQHNVCVGMSVFTEDLSKDYFCEQCAPDDHKTTLAAMAKGERPWEGRRQEYEDNKKKKKGKKGKGKRVSDSNKDRSSPSAAPSSSKPNPSPTPDVKKEEPAPAPESVASKGKRKSRDHSQGPQAKQRKISEPQPSPVFPKYNPPADLPASINNLEGTRKQGATGFQKSLETALDQAEKKGLYKLPAGSTKKAVTERLAIELERAFFDTHPANNNSASQLRTLVFNLKSNVEIAVQILSRTMPPTSFVVMTPEELASQELKRETADIRARAEKQATLVNEDGPRVRKTHKGDEVIEHENYGPGTDETPSALRRPSMAEPDSASTRRASTTSQNNRRSSSRGPLHVDTQGSQQSPKQNNFDIGRVFSSVQSPSASHKRRPSAPIPSAGPGDDPEVDRLLQDDANDSPPYSPTEELDADVVWRGPLAMTNVADITTTAKYVGGADLSKVRGIAWKDLIPAVLTVAGRIPEEKAVPYLCGLRYNNQIDLVITSLSPAHPADPNAKKQFLGVIDYFRSKKRYGVVGERKLGNVRDTYLVPVPEGDGPIPEPMQNIGDHLIPERRTEPMLLMVFVVRDDKHSQIPLDQQRSEMHQGTPSAISEGTPTISRNHSVATPTFSPATPQSAVMAPQAQAGPRRTPQYSQTPVPVPTIPGHPPPPMAQRQTPVAPPPAPGPDPHAPAMRAAQAEGEQKARQVLGNLFASATVTFLLPHAARMKEGEWNAVRRCLERDPRAREDLQLLSKLLTEEGNNGRKNTQPQAPQPSPPSVVQNTLTAAAANTPAKDNPPMPSHPPNRTV